MGGLLNIGHCINWVMPLRILVRVQRKDIDFNQKKGHPIVHVNLSIQFKLCTENVVFFVGQKAKTDTMHVSRRYDLMTSLLCSYWSN